MESTELVQPVLARAFASSDTADKNTIPASSEGAEDEVSLELGFPTIYSTLVKDGGKYISRADVNGILNLISKADHYNLAGGLVFFDMDMATAIGGYAKGAHVWYQNGSKLILLESMQDNNKVQPTGAYTYFIKDGVSTLYWQRVTGVDIDSALSGTSNNPVANSAITERISEVDENAVHKGSSSSSSAEDVYGVKTFKSTPVVQTMDDFDSAGNVSAPKAASAGWVINRIAKWWETMCNYFLRIVGGTMQGAITWESGTEQAIKCETAQQDLVICAGNDNDTYGTKAYENGASIALSGAAKGTTDDEYGVGGGQIALRAKGSDTSCTLKLTPGGVLTVNGNNLVRSINGTAFADENGNVSLAEADAQLIVPDFGKQVANQSWSRVTPESDITYTAPATGFYIVSSSKSDRYFTVSINDHLVAAWHSKDGCSHADTFSCILVEGQTIKFTAGSNKENQASLVGYAMRAVPI